MNVKSIFLFLSFCVFSITACDAATTTSLPNDREGWRNLLKWGDDCEKGVAHIIKAGVGFIGVDVYPLPDKSKLVTVVCRTGSYNQGVIVYQLKQKDSKLLVFPQIRFIEPKSEPGQDDDYFDPNKPVPANTVDKFFRYDHRLLWGNVLIDTQKQLITNNDFFRGGDTGCGLHTQYKLTNGKPEIVMFRARPHCRSNSVPIDKWKPYSKPLWSTWPKRPAPAWWDDLDAED